MSITTLFALFLLSPFALYPSLTTAQPIIDGTGKPVVTGSTYYIIPAIWAHGGGLRLGQTGNETCPLSVVQIPFELNNGLPLKISSPYRSYFLFPGSKLDLSFTTVPTCASTPSAWTVVKGLSGQPLVKVTGYENTLNGYFAIQESSTGFSLQNSYKFQFCTFDSDECANIGIVKGDNNDRQLGLISEDDPAFMFVLVNAETSSSSA